MVGNSATRLACEFQRTERAVMTNMKPPQEGRNTGAPSLRGLPGRSATGLNGQAAKEEVSALWRGGWMPENISGVPAGRSVFHLTSPLSRNLIRRRSLDQAVWASASVNWKPSCAAFLRKNWSCWLRYFCW